MAFLLVLTFKQSLQKTFISQKENCITGWYILDTSLAVAKSGVSVSVYLILSWCQASRYLAWEEKIKRILREQSYLKTTRETNVVGMTTWFWENMILSTKYTVIVMLFNSNSNSNSNGNSNYEKHNAYYTHIYTSIFKINFYFSFSVLFLCFFIFLFIFIVLKWLSKIILFCICNALWITVMKCTVN